MENYCSPRITGEILDCSMPMTFDTYSNCSYNCLYCFSQYQRGIGGAKDNYYKKVVKSVNVNKIIKLFENKGADTCFEYFIKNKKVMQWGGLSDQFDNFEKKYGKTLELLKYFKSIKYPLSFSTKAAWFTKDDRYLDLIQGTQDYWHFKISIITLDENKSKIIEGGCPTPLQRLEALKILSTMGNKTTLRLRPFIIGVSNPTYTDLIYKAIESGIYSVSTEFFCLENRGNEATKENYKKISNCCGFDILEFYRKQSCGSGYLRLNYQIKKPFIKTIEKICKENNIMLGVSDAHCKTIGNLGSCCGLPNDWNYFKGQLTEAIMRAKNNNNIFSIEIIPEIEEYKQINIIKDTIGFNTKNGKFKAKYKDFSIYEFLKNIWNDSKNHNSPCSYTDGCILPKEINENNNVVYKIKEI